jgi:hypothetical protein
MLAPDARAVLLDQLRPPSGSQLDHAVATTFTLDLAAALVPPLAFAAFGLRGSPDQIAVMEAVRSCTNRVDIFCQAGQIKVPRQASDLMAFPRTAGAPGAPAPAGSSVPPEAVAAALRERGRVRVPAAVLDPQPHHGPQLGRGAPAGWVAGRPSAASRPLADLVRALPGMATSALPEGRRERLAAFAEDLRRVDWERPQDVNEVVFHVFGLAGRRPQIDFSGYRHLVIAPFCNDRGLAVVAPETSPKVDVVSRPEDLDRLEPESAQRITGYVISALAGLEEPDQDGAAVGQQVLSGLHAKLYVVERNRLAHVFLGSPNATEAAFGGNVEVLVELIGGATKLGVGQFLDDDAPFAGLLEPYGTAGGAEPGPDDEARYALQNLLRALAEVPLTVTVEPQAGDHRLTITSAAPLDIPAGYRCNVELLTRPGTAADLDPGAPVQATFDGLPTADITPFLVLRAATPEGLLGGTAVRAVLVGDPAGRLDEVLARQVDTAEKFLRFLALLLGLSDGGAWAAAAAGADGAGAGWFASSAGVFELAVRALADRPDAIADLDQLVSRLMQSEDGQRVLPDGFADLWAVVADTHRRLTGRRGR